MPTTPAIVPIYKAEQTILETINSIQKQNFSNFELIIVDNGSKDKTLELLSKFQDFHSSFLYDNGGVSIARDCGLFHASRDFITFKDSCTKPLN